VSRISQFACNRRECLALLALVPALAFQNSKQETADDPGDWTCPMDRDVHLNHPGKCPRCGMTLLLKVPDRIEYPLFLSVEPKAIQPGQEARLLLRVLDPAGQQVRRFETVHEKLIHLFIISEDLEFFAHVHPVFQPDGSFVYKTVLPKPGMYRLLADYYPAGSVPQLALETLYVRGPSRPAQLNLSLDPRRASNLTASLRLEPVQVMAGLEARLFYTLTPNDGLERYLGAWGHMLIASEDLIDLMHLHPFLANTSTIQYNVIFPRPGNYKVWSQFQRLGVVNTVAFSLKVTRIF
jgi:hypothetical protein